MSQIFCDHIPDIGEEIVIEGDDFHHLLHVRRHVSGDIISLRTEEGWLVQSLISGISSKSLTLRVTSIDSSLSKPYTLTLAMPILKGKKNDLIIEKGVEAGVTSFIPVLFDRSIPDISHAEKKLLRWQKIADEAYKQSNAVFKAAVKAPIDSHSLFQHDTGCSASILCDVHEEALLTADMVSSSVICAVGPEGGFSPEEIDKASGGNWKRVSLMTNQLRAESAAIIIPAIIRHFMYL